MTRRLRAWNRVASFVVGLVLLASGLAALAWWRGDLRRWWPGTPDRIDVVGTAAPTAAWWPWAVLGVGIALTALALWWLLAHLRPTRLDSLSLAGSGSNGRLTLSTSPAVHHLGVLVRELPRVTGYRATMVRERGRPVLAATVRVTADADLPELTDRLTALAAEFTRAASIPDLGIRIRILVIRPAGRPRRLVA